MKKRKKKIIYTIITLILIVFLILPIVNMKKINTNLLSNESSKKINSKTKKIRNEKTNENISEEKKIVEENESKDYEPKQTEEEENKNENFDLNGIKINLIGDEEIYLNLNDKYIEQGAKAYTKDNKDISSLIKIDGTVDTSKEGSYIITYYIGKAVVIRSVFVK